MKLTTHHNEDEKHPLEGKHAWLDREGQEKAEEAGEGGDGVEDEEDGRH